MTKPEILKALQNVYSVKELAKKKGYHEKYMYNRLKKLEEENRLSEIGLEKIEINGIKGYLIKQAVLNSK